MTLTRVRALAAVAVALAVSAGSLLAQSGQSVGRTPWGDPDLQGTWTNSDESGIAMQRPPEFAGKKLEDITPGDMERLITRRAEQAVKTAQTIGGTSEEDTGAGPTHWYENYNAKNSRAWMISDPPDGQMPAITEEARKRAAAVRAARRGGDGYYIGPFDKPSDLTLYVRCITRGLPGSMMPAIYGNSYRLVQSPGFVAITYEMVHETRIIPIEGRGAARPHNSPRLGTYWGDATARWEGDTLVIDTVNFNGKSNFRGSSDGLHTVERFTRVGPSKVDFRATIDDPKSWTRQWSYAITWTEDDSQPIFEYACHEGNYGLRNILSAGRSDDKKGVQSSDSVDAQADLKDEFE